MTIIDRIRQTAILLTTGLFFSTVSASASTETFSGNDGPVSARMQIHDGHYPVLKITYRGYLFECMSWNYGRSPVTVNIVYVTPDGSGGQTSVVRSMSGTCRNYWNDNEPEEAYVVTAASDHDGLLHEIFRGQDLSGDRYYLQLAFVRHGRWDSRYGGNYHLWLERSAAPE